jgi:hypothetical protein
MKRTILLIAILSILFVFSSCDPILEALFPEATGGGDKGEDANNTIEVGVDVDPVIFDSQEYRECWIPIIIRLEVDYGYGWEFYDQRDIWCHWESYIYERFEWLPPDNYRVVVFYDEDNNWEYSEFDSVALAWDYNVSPPQDYVPVGNGGWYYLGAYLQAGYNELMMMP